MILAGIMFDASGIFEGTDPKKKKGLIPVVQNRELDFKINAS